MRVKPYYILHADLEEGIGHFRTTIAEGKAIMDGLRGHISGLAVPQFVIDLPDGGGKVPVVPDYERGRVGDEIVYRNYLGREIAVPA